MRIVGSQARTGTVYRIYREDEQFVAQVKRLMPFLVDHSGDVFIGGSEDDPHVVLVIGPLDEASDEAFRKQVSACLG